MMVYILVSAVGVVVGLFLAYRLLGDDFGRLRIDRSDDQPYLFLELDGSLEELLKRDRIILKVEDKDYVQSRK